ncbi:hypothetical protein L6452_29577 [Arctium lappa]|uniref:Uncharacterized protein n=1 Tax=Arctium lappa TaxID=4217 RepID=A0ACB8ZGS7_ARCLA|nr:hypothetical protein L6452_29577 [Arctium lappa]
MVSIPAQDTMSSYVERPIESRSMSEASESKPASQLSIDLKGLILFFTGKRAFIAGVTDDNGYGWAIAKSLVAAGAKILVGTWVPALNIFEMSLRRGKFDGSRVCESSILNNKAFRDDILDDKLRAFYKSEPII